MPELIGQADDLAAEYYIRDMCPTAPCVIEGLCTEGENDRHQNIPLQCLRLGCRVVAYNDSDNITITFGDSYCSTIGNGDDVYKPSIDLVSSLRS